MTKNFACMVPMLPMVIMRRSMAAWTNQNKIWTSCGTVQPKEDSRNAGAAVKQKKSTGQPNLVEVATAAGSFKSLVGALSAAELVATLKSEGPFTVFAPSDEAFSKVPAEVLEGISKDPSALKSVLLGHVVPGIFRSSDLPGIDALKAVGGTALKVNLEEGVHIGNARVVQTDIPASNGVIHVIDTVLLPSGN